MNRYDFIAKDILAKIDWCHHCGKLHEKDWLCVVGIVANDGLNPEISINTNGVKSHMFRLD